MINFFFFRYGVKDISIKGDKILIQLNYSPKESTLIKKFGDLPIKYIRTRLENEEEIRLFEKAIKRYKFNWDEEPASETTSLLDKPVPSQLQQIATLTPQPSSSSQKNTNADYDDILLLEP